MNSRPIPVVSEAEFLAFVKKAENGCCEWMGRIFNGYGLWPTGHFAHRVAYVLYKGPIPADLELDHLCRNRTCVNPDHLEPVSHRDNTNRGFAVTVPQRTHCKRGHPWTPENTIRWRNYRYCRECARNGWRAYSRRRRAPGGKRAAKTTKGAE